MAVLWFVVARLRRCFGTPTALSEPRQPQPGPPESKRNELVLREGRQKERRGRYRQNRKKDIEKEGHREEGKRERRRKRKKERKKKITE